MRAPVLTDRRAEIVQLLRGQPGLSKATLARELGVDCSSVDYHLHVLVRARVVVRERAGGVVAYFVNGTSPPERSLIARRRDEAKRVLEVMRATPGWHRCCDLATACGFSRGPTRNALRALERAGLARRSAYAHWEATA